MDLEPEQELQFEPSIPLSLVGRTDLWRPEYVIRLKELHTNRYTNSQIAQKINDEFGTSFTRNAIIGKCSRLGLKGNPHVPDSPEPVTRIYAPPRKLQSRSRRHAYQQPIKVVQPVRIEPEFLCEPVALLDLEPHQCRWPVTPDDAPRIKFCGASRWEPFSYCQKHFRKAHYLPRIRTAAEYELEGRRMRKMRKNKGLAA